jgi:hypothetical protein
VCDYGYAGEDCSFKLCPMAFEPLSLPSRPNRRTVRLITGFEGGGSISGDQQDPYLAGLLEFSFGGFSVLLNADALELDSFACSGSLSSGLKAAVSEVSCIREIVNERYHSGSYLVTLHSFPVKPHLNNLFFHSGNPPLDLFFACNASRFDESLAPSPYCYVEDVVTENLPGKILLLLLLLMFCFSLSR